MAAAPPFWIPSSSMQDTLMINDKVLVSKLVYHFRSIQPDRGIGSRQHDSGRAGSPGSPDASNPRSQRPSCSASPRVGDMRRSRACRRRRAGRVTFARPDRS
jgi:hypothetical protein